MGASRHGLAGSLVLAGTISSLLGSAALAQQSSLLLPSILVTASRLGSGIVGASTSVITGEEIARSPASTLQDIIGLQPGVQTRSTFGGVSGAGTTIDLRGFGAAAASNTVVLINGRRLTDIDLASVDFSAIPKESIERIEITRGNSGAVLYGDGAVGGVVNIVTRTGVGLPPSVKVGGGYGTFQQREGNLAANASKGPYSVSVAGNVFDSDGYRVNNAVRQRNVVADLRYAGDGGTVYANITADDQKLGLPGARRVTLTSSLVATDPKGATTPTAFANKQGISGTLGFTRMLANGLEMIIDGGVREKRQQAYSEISGFESSDARVLTTYSLTPRLIANGSVFGVPHKTIAGVDIYHAILNSNRSQKLTDRPVHRYSLNQTSVGVYWQQTLSVTSGTDISFGARGQQTMLSARDTFDGSAPGGAFETAALPLDTVDAQHALHLGIEHRLMHGITVFGRIARSFRTPNVDERVGVQSSPVDFRLRTQTSRDIEGGVRLKKGPFEVQTSGYEMVLNDEIHFRPDVFANVNLDPTRRYGTETSATWKVLDNVTLKGGFAYTRSVFREGPFAGKDVPLVSRWTAGGAVSWNVWDKYLVADAVVRYIGERRMDNDQRNFQPLIPAHTLVDLRLGGEYKNLFWSIAIQNLFDVRYFDYAVASSTTFGTYNAYPQPGRMFMARLGATLPP
ncbi:MAG: TonB-dependent receptor [Alphaproteobacteria bacterium]|nr:TonB-dependent receptor [Alphaproteobacteria bacterium]